MKQPIQKQCSGVWLDNHQAVIISHNSDNDNEEYAVHNKVEAPEMNEGGSEHAMNNAKKADTLKYFKSVASRLLSFDRIYIFGPGKAQEQFQNHLKEDAQFNDKKITIGTADNLTDPQMIAKVRDFYKLQQS